MTRDDSSKPLPYASVPTPELQLDIVLGRELRDDGMAKAEEAEERWSQRASEWIDSLIRSGREFSSEDVREAIGAPRHLNAIGAIMKRAVASDRLVEVGRVQSQRPLARGRRIPLYRGR